MPRLTIRQHVHAPLAEVFDRFVDIGRYPESVRRAHAVRTDADNPQTLWFRYQLAGIERQFCIVVTVDRSRFAVAWRSTVGPGHTGAVHFRTVNPHGCTMVLRLELHTHHLVDAMGTMLGLVRPRLEHELHRFAAHVEHATGYRPARDGPDHRAPSEKLFDAVFPTDARREHP